MAEELRINLNLSKQEKYEELLPQIKALTEGEKDAVANMANVSSALKMAFNFLWVGFYIYKNDELVLGPFQGPIACTRISLGRGVCGKAFQNKETLIVEDVNDFPDHIACSSESKSEIVVPFFGKNIQGVLDLDSNQLSSFDKEDAYYLKSILELIF